MEVPNVPVTVIRYVPAGVPPEVVMVNAGVAGGVADSGLTVHCGASVTWFEVTWQLNETGLLKPGLAPRSMVAVAVPPGLTPAKGVSADTVTVNSDCP